MTMKPAGCFEKNNPNLGKLQILISKLNFY